MSQPTEPTLSERIAKTRKLYEDYCATGSSSARRLIVAAIAEHGLSFAESCEALAKENAELREESRQLREAFNIAVDGNIKHQERHANMAMELGTLRAELAAERADRTKQVAILRAVIEQREAEAGLAVSMLAAERAKREWRDISTAPKDGTEILVWRKDTGPLIARWLAPNDFLNESEVKHFSEATDWETPDWFYADFLQGGRLDEPPTHWQPLPSAPAQEVSK